MMIALLALVVGWKLSGREIWNRASLLYYQHQCMTYEAPPDQIVFDTNPAGVAMLANDKNYMVTQGCAVRIPPVAVDRLPAWYWQTNGVRYMNSPRTLKPEPILFLHELHVPHGQPYVVAVWRAGDSSRGPTFANYSSDLVAAAMPAFEWNTSIIPLTSLSIGPDEPEISAHHDLRIFAGQIDPADPAHFTIRYQDNGVENVVDGRLTKDGDLQFVKRTNRP